MKSYMANMMSANVVEERFGTSLEGRPRKMCSGGLDLYQELVTFKRLWITSHGIFQ